MIEDTLKDLAHEYAFDTLDAAERERFEQLLAHDAELGGYVEELRSVSSDLALLATPVDPPADLRERILAATRRPPAVPTSGVIHFPPPGEAPRVVVATAVWARLLPWAIAAGAVMTAAYFWLAANVLQTKYESELAAHAADVRALSETREASAAEREQGAALSERLAEADAKIRSMQGQISAKDTELDTIRKELSGAQTALAEARSRADLAQMQVATLTSQINARYLASVAWDAENQAGILRVTRLPANQPEKSYQLWVIDGATEKPVSAGVFQIHPDGSATVTFRTDSPVPAAAAFAVSVEAAGGSKAAGPQGPIILMGEPK